MDIIIYIGVAALCVWAACTLVRRVRAQLKGSCSCGGDCSRCGRCPSRK